MATDESKIGIVTKIGPRIGEPLGVEPKPVTEPPVKTTIIEPTDQPIYTVTYIADMRERVRTFGSLADANAFIESRQDKQMKDAGFDGTWVEFKTDTEQKTVAVGQALASGLITYDNGTATLTKPVSVMSDAEIDLANSIGFNLPKLPIGPSFSLYQWAEDQDPKSWLGEQTVDVIKMSAATMGTFFEGIHDAYQFVAGLFPGEQPGEGEIRQVTAGTLTYLEDLTPTQQRNLDVRGLMATVGASYLLSFPVGFTVKGLGMAAGAIAGKIGVTSPSGIRTILTFLQAHPKVAQAVIYAPMVGMEAHLVYQDIQAGGDVDQTLRDMGYRIARKYGRLQGFRAGHRALTKAQMAKLLKLVKIEEIRTPEGTKIVPTIDSRDIPKEFADIIAKDKNIKVISGKEVVVGTDAKSGLPVAREYGPLLVDLAHGKTVGPDAVKGAILNYVTTEQYDSLLQAGLNIETMTHIEIATLMLKELNWGAGSPWAGMLADANMQYQMGGGTINVIGAFSEVVPDENILGTAKAQKAYDSFISGGMSGDQALKYVTELSMGTSPMVVIQMAQDAGLDQYVVSTIAEAFVTYGATSAEGTLLAQNLSQAGLTAQEMEITIPMLVSPLSATLIVENLPDLSVTALATVIPALDQNTLQQALQQMSTPDLMKVVPVLDNTAINTILPYLDQDQLVKVVPLVSIDILPKILPLLNPVDLANIVSQLNRTQLDVFIDNISDLSFDQITESMTKLDQETLTRMMMVMPQSLLNYIESLPPGRIKGLPRLRKRLKKFKSVQRSRVAEPYRVTFHHPSVKDEKRRVMARSFREALITAKKLRKRRVMLLQVKVEKLRTRLKSR